MEESEENGNDRFDVLKAALNGDPLGIDRTCRICRMSSRFVPNVSRGVLKQVLALVALFPTCSPTRRRIFGAPDGLTGESSF